MDISRRRFVALGTALMGTWKLLLGSARADQSAITATTLRSGNSRNVLWFRQPAEQWLDALPVGNGRLGAMVFGGIRQERIALNEDTLWSGYPRDWNNPQAKEHLPVVRRLVLKDEDYEAADSECLMMQGPFNQAYQPLGDLWIEHEIEGEPTKYLRALDLESAIARVSYSVGGATYLREVFSSAPDQVISVHWTTDKPGGLNCTLRLATPLHGETHAEGIRELHLTGKAPSQSLPNYVSSEQPIVYDDQAGRGMNFAAVLRLAHCDGHASVTPDGLLRISGATTVDLVLGAATGFRGNGVAPDLSLEQVLDTAAHAAANAASISHAALQTAHMNDFRALFDRVHLDLDQTGAPSTDPIDERLAKFASDPDPALLALYFQMGRYLLISSSRPGTQPANLQGIWNAELRPPWSSNWTSNINVQMNYWLAETCNLSECHLPLADMVKDLSENGRITARVNYGADGWVSHHNIDLWRQSAPVGMGSGSPTWANFCMSGPWLCAHLWDHFLFTGDQQFLEETAYPVMKGAAEFCLSWLIEDENGDLTTCPSVSTENTFIAPDGKEAEVSSACTLDLALIRELFSNCDQAARVLGKDAEFAAKLAAAVKRLPPYRIGRFGQLQEWSVDFRESTPGQRHMSHLYPVYPGVEIMPTNNPGLARAARVSLESRLAHGGAYTGWSRAWAIGIWARLCDGDMAWDSLRMLIEHSTNNNLFDLHPFESTTKPVKRASSAKKAKSNHQSSGSIFQIDGNFGASASIAEMLLQSQNRMIQFLPALPKAWQRGSVQGLRARGGIEISMVWERGRLRSASVLALRNGEHIFSAPQGQQFQEVFTSLSGHREPVDFERADTGLIRVKVREGEKYEFVLS